MFKTKTDRFPTQKEQELIKDLRSLSTGDCQITVVATEPVSMTITGAQFQEPSPNPLTSVEHQLLSLIRFMSYGDFFIKVQDNVWQIEDSKNVFKKKY